MQTTTTTALHLVRILALSTLLFLALIPSPSHAASCTNTLTSSTAIPTGYGASYNPLTTTKEYLIQASCTGTTQATVTAGNGNSTTYVYNRGYYYTGTTWTPYTLTCASGALIGGAWCPGRATAVIPLPQNPQNVIAYTCQYTNSTWKCGCRDATCSTAYWQLQRVGVTETDPPTNPPTSGARTGIIATSDYETGAIAPNSSVVDGAWVGTIRNRGYVNSESAISTTNGGFGPSTDYDVKVTTREVAPTTPNGPGETITPRTGNYFLSSTIYKYKDYRGVNGQSPGDPGYTELSEDGTSYHYDKPRLSVTMTAPAKRWSWDEEAWIGLSIYLPSNMEYDLGVRDHRTGNTLFPFFGVDINTDGTMFSLSYYCPPGSNEAHWYLHTNTGMAKHETDAGVTGKWTPLGSVAGDKGKWTDFVIRTRVNPATVSGTYNGQYLTANRGILEIWKSTGPVTNTAKDRAMVKVFSEVNKPFGLLPNDADDEIYVNAPRQYKYGWKRTTNKSTVVGPVFVGFDGVRIGRAALGASFSDVHPTRMVQP